MTPLERQQAAALIAACKLDPEVWFMNYAVIKTKNGRMVTGAVPERVQLRMFEHYRECRKMRVPCKMLVYKSRRMGASTAAQAILYHHGQTHPGFVSKLMANKDETAEDVFVILRRFANNDRCPWIPGVEAVKTDIEDRVVLANGSEFRKLSAKGERPGHGDAAQTANLTEVAHYQGANDALTAFLPSVEAAFTDADGLIIADSTPCGSSGWFYKQVLEALEREKAGRQQLSDWKLIFEPWWEKSDAKMPLLNAAEREEFVESLAKDEREELEKFGKKGVTLEHMKWRRAVIRDTYAGDIDKFRQECPSDPIEGFLGSGRPRFDAVSVAKAMERAAGMKHETGVLDLNEHSGDEAVVFVPDDSGEVEMAEDPRWGMKYLVSWDTMTGEDQLDDGARQEPDWHSIGVIRDEFLDEHGVIHPARLVMRHGSRLAIEVAAEIARRMSIFYGVCLIVPEVNNSGLAGVKYLEERGAPIISRSRIDQRSERETEQLGWKTDQLTRKTIIDALARGWREGKIDVPFTKTLRQMQTFVSNRNGRYEALSGEFDDEVLMLAIGYYNLARSSERRLPKRKIWGGRNMPDSFRRMF